MQIFLRIVFILFVTVLGFLSIQFKVVSDNKKFCTILFKIISPIIFFIIPAEMYITQYTCLVFFISFLSTFLLSVSINFLSNFFFEDKKYVILLLSSTANSGYFMIPIARIIFDEHKLNLYITAVIGISLYEHLISNYIFNKINIISIKNNFIDKKSLFKLPIFYTFVLGIIFNICCIDIPIFLYDIIFIIKMSFSIFGMIILGTYFKKISYFDWDLSFILNILGYRFVLYPLIMIVFDIINTYIFSGYDIQIYSVLLFLSLSPLSVNALVFADDNNLFINKVSTAVFLSLLLSIIFILIFTKYFI